MRIGGGTTIGLSPDPDERGRGRARPAAAVAVLAASLAGALAALVLVVLNDPEWSTNQWYFAVDLTNGIVYGVVAWLMLNRLNHPVAWVIAATGVGGSLAALSYEWTQALARHPDLPGLPWLVSAQQWAWIPGAVALKAVVPWLIRRDGLDRAARAWIVIGLVATFGLTLVRLLDPWVPWNDPQLAWGPRMIVVLGLIAAADVTRRWRGHTPEQRRGLGWLALGVLLKTMAFVPLALPVDLASQLPVWFTPVLSLLSEPIFPAAVLVTVLRQRLWGIDLAVSRTVVWSLLTGGVAVAYLGTVAILTPLFDQDGPAEMLATALVVAGFGPGRRWLQRRVDRLVHGDGAVPLQALRRVSVHLGVAGTERDVLTGVASSLATSLRLGSVAIRAAGPGGELVAQVGEPAGEEVVVQLDADGGVVGCLVVTARPGERLDGRARASLDDIAPLVTATLQLAQARHALLLSRRRLADARDEERRALRRELHDGLGPALAGVGLGLRAARNRLAQSDADVAPLLDQLGVEIEHRVEEVRSLSRGLLPPTLGNAGLVPALDELTARYAVTGLDVSIDVLDDGVTDLSAEVTNAVYAIVAEAVRNVHRHAGARRCEVVLSLSSSGDGSLLVTVTDDGSGVDGSAVPGVGLTSMRERAEGLGGTFRFESRPLAGARVSVLVPQVALAAAS